MLSKALTVIVTTLGLAAGLAGLIQPELQAQESEPVSQALPEIDRWGFSFHVGDNNVGLHFLGTSLSYRPAFGDDRLRIVAQYDLNLNTHTPTSQAAWLGVHHDFYVNPEWANLRVYSRWLLGALSLFNPGQPGPNDTTVWTAYWIPGFQLGVGAEAQIAGPLWGFAQLSSGLPLILRPEIGLRMAF
ncbi:MAG: hypothetical protein ACO1RX_14825 [Candidatus Sericytochromatia bacterium]